MKCQSRVPASLAIMIVMSAGADGVLGQEKPDWVTDANIAAGAQVYMGPGICVACHGADAKGTIGPDLTDEEWLHGDGSPAAILERVLKGVSAAEAKGVTGAIMPPKGGSAINDIQAKAVAAYIWSLSRQGG